MFAPLPEVPLRLLPNCFRDDSESDFRDSIRLDAAKLLLGEERKVSVNSLACGVQWRFLLSFFVSFHFCSTRFGVVARLCALVLLDHALLCRHHVRSRWIIYRGNYGYPAKSQGTWEPIFWSFFASSVSGCEMVIHQSELLSGAASPSQ